VSFVGATHHVATSGFLDEVALTMNKRRYWLWRAVHQDGTVLDILVQSRRDQHAAARFLHRVLDAEHGVEPRVIVTNCPLAERFPSQPISCCPMSRRGGPVRADSQWSRRRQRWRDC